MKLVSFNLRNVWDSDGINSFVSRAGGILDRLAHEAPDVVCFQEGMQNNTDFLRRALASEYEFYFHPRNADYSGEGLALALRRGQVFLYRLDFFWLSDTPQVPGSRFPVQSVCPRICQCALLRTAAGQFLRVYNVHLDHESDDARIRGIRCALERVEQDWKDCPYPFFLLGDFNALPGSETIRWCDAYAAVPLRDLTADCGGTWHDFGRAEPQKLDYIYTDAATAARPHTVERWTQQTNGIYLSDHYPVALSIDLA